MSKFYTVTINRLQLVSKFDEHGVKISDTVIKVPVVHNDLPYATALMYQQKGAPGEVTIVEQFAEYAPARRERKRATEYIGGHVERPAPKHLGSEDIVPDDDVLAAAKAGDMGAAITAELEEAS